MMSIASAKASTPSCTSSSALHANNNWRDNVSVFPLSDAHLLVADNLLRRDWGRAGMHESVNSSQNQS